MEKDGSPYKLRYVPSERDKYRAILRSYTFVLEFGFEVLKKGGFGGGQSLGFLYARRMPSLGS